MRRLGACAAIALLVGPLYTAHGALCQGKGGQLFARESCRKRERAIEPGTFGDPGPDGAVGGQGAPGDPAVFPLRLVDANDVELGRIVQFYPSGATVEIANPNVPTPLVLFVIRSGFQSESNVGLYYQGNDCEGVPFFPPPSDDESTIVPPVARVIGTAAYYSTGMLQNLTYGATEFFPSGGAPCPGSTTATTRATCCSTTGGSTSNVGPAARVLLSVFGLVPPFRAVLR